MSYKFSYSISRGNSDNTFKFKCTRKKGLVPNTSVREDILNDFFKNTKINMINYHRDMGIEEKYGISYNLFKVWVFRQRRKKILSQRSIIVGAGILKFKIDKNENYESEAEIDDLCIAEVEDIMNYMNIAGGVNYKINLAEVKTYLKMNYQN